MKNWKTPLSLLLAAFIVRLLYYFALYQNIVVGSDASTYIKLGGRFAAGDFYGLLNPYWAPLYPFLVGIVSLFSSSLELPGIIVSIVTGSLTILATYFLTHQSYGQRSAVIASIFAALYPHLLNTTFEIDTESLYLLCTMFALIAGWNALVQNSARRFFVTGILIGLAYLTRPEAIGYLLFFALLPFSRFYRRNKTSLTNCTRQIFVFLLGFFLLAAPYLCYLKSATGEWTISAKFRAHILIGKFSDKAPVAGKANVKPPTTAFETAKALVRTVAYNSHKMHKFLPYLFPPLLLMIMFLGLFRSAWDRQRLKREIYLLFFCFLTVLGYLLTVVEVRYFYVLLPILLGWLARGIVEAENWWHTSLANLRVNNSAFRIKPLMFIITCIILINIYLFPLQNFMRSNASDWEFLGFEQKAAGIWLKEHGKPAPRILAVNYLVPFYAEGEYLPLSSDNLNEILTKAKENQADYLVVDERNIKKIPAVESLLNETTSQTELEIVYRNEEKAGYKILIYHINSLNAP